MSCYAQGRCHFCSQKHTLPVFGSAETEHKLIQKSNFKLIVLDTVCGPCITKIEYFFKKLNTNLPSEEIIVKEEHDITTEYNDIITNEHFTANTNQPGESLELCGQLKQEMTINEGFSLNAEINDNSYNNIQENISKCNLTKTVNKKRKKQPHLSCDFCQKKFNHTGDLNKHRRRHTGEQPYTCTNCQQKFSHASNLVRHQRMHSGERPFLCQQCGRSFARKDKLSYHIMCCVTKTLQSN